MLTPFIITGDETNQRYDKFLRKYFKAYPLVSLKDIFARMRKGYIKVNGRKHPENYRVQKGDEINFDRIPKHEQQKLIRSKEDAIELIDTREVQKRIAYEDPQRLAFNKPAGIVIHGGTKNEETLSLHDYLQRYLFNEGKAENASPTFSASFCYRLDKDTSGVIIAATTFPALQLLNELIRDRKVSKQYHAIVVGKPPAEGSCVEPLFKGFDKKYGRSKSFVNYEKGQNAMTHYKTLATQETAIGEVSLLQITIETGRMHQIRVHMSHL